MEERNIFFEVEQNIEEVIARDTPMGSSLWQVLLDEHPADIAEFLGTISKDPAHKLFTNFDHSLQLKIFKALSDPMKVFMLGGMSDPSRVQALHELTIDKLTDVFDCFSDEQLKMYLNLLHKHQREHVLSLLQFEPDSAGGIMDTEVLSLMTDFTVDQSIKLLQRVRPNRDIHQQIYVTNRAHMLEGHINLQDLVLQKPEARISEFMQENDLVVRPIEDQESVAKKMVHYGLLTVPVVDDNNHFLGAIASDALVDVLVQEASEDVHKMGAVLPLRRPYFEVSFFWLLYQRSYVLIALFIAESFSGPILRSYEGVMTAILVSFLPTLTSAGGNSGSQASAVAIQGLASGEFDSDNMGRLLRREFTIALVMSCFLGLISFLRVYYVGGTVLESCAVSGSLAIIIFISGLLGTGIPFMLRRLNIDPAFSAGPFLSTLMDILGIVIFCHLSKMLLFG